MIGHSPGLYWRICWKYLSPTFLLVSAVVVGTTISSDNKTKNCIDNFIWYSIIEKKTAHVETKSLCWNTISLFGPSILRITRLLLYLFKYLENGNFYVYLFIVMAILIWYYDVCYLPSSRAASRFHPSFNLV